MRRMIASLVLTGLTAAGAATALTPPAGRLPPRDTPFAPAIGHAKIQGQVIAADSKRPLRRAQVTLSAPSLGNTGRTTMTTSRCVAIPGVLKKDRPASGVAISRT